MACFLNFGSDENKEKVAKLQKEILSLKKELVRLKSYEIEADIASNSESSDEHSEKQEDTEALNALKQQLEDQTSKLEELQNGIDELKAENETLKASQQLLKAKNKAKGEEITKLKQMNGANKYNNDDEKEQPSTPITPRPKQKGKKYNLNKLEDQIEVLSSEGQKARSTLLCIRPETVTTHSDNNTKTRSFGFIQFLETSMGDKVVDQLYSKFKSESVDGKQLASLMTLAVIIYRVKLHKMKTGSTAKPPMDSSSIKGSVEHLAAWIIRSFGNKTNEKKRVTVQDDAGKTVQGEYRVYSAKFNKKTFKHDVTVWVNQYVESGGKVNEV